MSPPDSRLEAACTLALSSYTDTRISDVDSTICFACARHAGVVFASKPFCNLLRRSEDAVIGLSPEQFVFRDIPNILNADVRPGFLAVDGGVNAEPSMSLLVSDVAPDAEPSWALLHIVPFEHESDAYTLSIMQLLSAPVPRILRGSNPTTLQMHAPLVHETLRKARAPLCQRQWQPCERLTAPKEVCDEGCLKLAELMEDSSEGDHCVPKLGGASVTSFASYGRLRHIVMEMEQKIRGTWATLDEDFKLAEEEIFKVTACAVADPSAEDCALVYISPGFETLTGYSREFSLGRNCRFLQPNNKSRNEAFNGSEVARMRTFCTQQTEGTILTLLLNEEPSGKHFWNLLFMQHLHLAEPTPAHYIFALQTNIFAQKETLDLLLPQAWTQQSLERLRRLRAILHGKEVSFSPEHRSLLSLANEVTSEWVLEAGKETTEFWEGGHYIPKVGDAAVHEFEDKWPQLWDVAGLMAQRMHNLSDDVMGAMAKGQDRTVACAVADPSTPDCPLVFVSSAFEELTGYKSDFALSRNCRFLQPNEAVVNEVVNGPEVPRMREFCRNPQAPGTQIINMLLNESRTGKRFWNLLHMEHVELAGSPYILAIQTNLNLPMPDLIQQKDATRGSSLYMLEGFLSELGTCLETLRCTLRQKLVKNISDVTKEALDCIRGFLMLHCDSYEGDIFVPCRGLGSVSNFQVHVVGRHEGMESERESARFTLQKLWGEGSTKAKGIAFSVADPAGEDCPLVFVSEEFQELTGYDRAYACGRNCRFLEVKDRERNALFNKEEGLRLRTFCSSTPAAQAKDKPDRLAVLMVNESKNRIPFLNYLVMEHTVVKERAYIFAMQANVVQMPDLIGELFVAGEGIARQELTRLREIFQKEEHLLRGYACLTAFIHRCVVLWARDFPGILRLPSVGPMVDSPFSLPLVGLEVTSETIISELIPQALAHGVRHFQFATRGTKDHSNANHLMMSLKLAQLFAGLTRGHFHCLTPVMKFTFRTTPENVDSFTPIIRVLKLHGFEISCLLLDISGVADSTESSLKIAAAAWKKLLSSKEAGEVVSIGLHGGGDKALTRIMGMAEPGAISVYSFELQPGRILDTYYQQAILRVRNQGAVLQAFNVFGGKQRMLENDFVVNIAKRFGLDPAVAILKWVEQLGLTALMKQLPSSLLANRTQDSRSYAELFVAPDSVKKSLFDDHRAQNPDIHGALIATYRSSRDAAALPRLFSDTWDPENSKQRRSSEDDCSDERVTASTTASGSMSGYSGDDTPASPLTKRRTSARQILRGRGSSKNVLDGGAVDVPQPLSPRSVSNPPCKPPTTTSMAIRRISSIRRSSTSGIQETNPRNQDYLFCSQAEFTRTSTLQRLGHLSPRDVVAPPLVPVEPSTARASRFVRRWRRASMSSVMPSPQMTRLPSDSLATSGMLDAREDLSPKLPPINLTPRRTSL